jgi:predicted O-linked N-acetylglucosamine transferase (SPINDLY family)
MIWPFKARGDREAASACHREGLELLKQNQTGAAIARLERAVSLDAGNAEFHRGLGNARRTAGDPEGAAACYRRALEIAPDDPAALYNLGLVLAETGRREEAERQFRRVHELDPTDVDAMFNLASLLADLARFAEAVPLYRRALEIAPDNPYLWLGLGLACQGLPGQLEESLGPLRKCIELKPDLADARYELGVSLYSLGRIDEAARSYEATLKIAPDHSRAMNDLGNILQGERRFDDAMKRYLEAIRLAPGNAVAHSNLGNVMLRQGRLDEAARYYRLAIELQPDFSDAHLNLGAIHTLKGAHERAIQCYERALELHPFNAIARENLLTEMQQICDWSRLEELCEAQRRSVRDWPDQAISPYSLLSIPSTPQEQLACARHYAANRARAVARDRERLAFRHERGPKPRLRVGYLSADFREHPGAYLIPELVELHDRAGFEIIGYSYGPDDGSAIRARLARAFDRFVDLSALPHAEAAARIHGDAVDILLDLTGYTMYNRPQILALRPAPIQVNFLGYPGTLGADFVDYLVTNRFVTPPGRAADYSEALVYMPGSYQVNDRKREVADTPPRRELGLPDGAVVFCCLSQNLKILPDVYAAWMRLLNAVPGSVVWLVDTSPQAVANLRREAQKHGIGPERLVFAPRVPIAQHLGRLRAADLFLDTFPYNAHSTTSDSLWVGLPVLTRAGETFASRAAGSQLAAIEVPELITCSLEEYEALALRLARRPAELAALREKLSRNRLTSPLFDTPGYTRHLETAFRQMWDRFLAGEAPRAIEVSAAA